VEGSEGGEEGDSMPIHRTMSRSSHHRRPKGRGGGRLLAGARAWSRHRIEEVAIDSTVEGQDREMTIMKLPFPFLPRRRSMCLPHPL
jgi:hypothetical protein